MKVWALIARELEGRGSCALVSVVRAEGSVPREEGARMVVSANGFHGTIGGGTLEWKALAEAQRLIGKPRQVKMLTQSLGPDLGQCCGGRVTLAIESFDLSSLGEVQALALREAEGPFTLTSRLPGISEHYGERQRQLMVFGAGHVGRALILALAPLPFAVTWVDPRPGAFPAAMPQNVTGFAGDPLDAVAAAEPGSLAMIMSHSHALDLALTDAALRCPSIAHVGLIGSATKRARFQKRLSAAGIGAERLAGLICPIGIGGIRSKHPAAIAVAVTAQLITLDEALSAAGTEGMLAGRDAG